MRARRELVALAASAALGLAALPAAAAESKPVKLGLANIMSGPIAI